MKHAWDDDAPNEAIDPPEARRGSFSRGFLIAVPLALVLWAVVAWLI